MAYKIADIDDLYLAITRLTTHAYNKDKSVNSRSINSATGFFYRNAASENYFLITSRHVLIDEAKGHFPNVVRLYLHTDANDLTKNGEFDLNLHDGTHRLWRESRVPNYDVVALPFTENSAPDAQITVFSDDFFFPQDYKLSLGHEVMTIGYPLGFWYDHVHNLPIIRSGVISSVYPIPYNNQPYFLVDSRLHKGTSGAPVITAGGKPELTKLLSKKTLKKTNGGLVKKKLRFEKCVAKDIF
jgi:hypothetical protein